jgi:hypothetical protein
VPNVELTFSVPTTYSPFKRPKLTTQHQNKEKPQELLLLLLSSPLFALPWSRRNWKMEANRKSRIASVFFFLISLPSVSFAYRPGDIVPMSKMGQYHSVRSLSLSIYLLRFSCFNFLLTINLWFIYGSSQELCGMTWSVNTVPFLL